MAWQPTRFANGNKVGVLVEHDDGQIWVGLQPRDSNKFGQDLNALSASESRSLVSKVPVNAHGPFFDEADHATPR